MADITFATVIRYIILFAIIHVALRTKGRAWYWTGIRRGKGTADMLDVLLTSLLLGWLILVGHTSIAACGIGVMAASGFNRPMQKRIGEMLDKARLRENRVDRQAAK